MKSDGKNGMIGRLNLEFGASPEEKPRNIKEMNKTELVNEIAEKAGLNKTTSKAALDACLGAIGEALSRNEKVQLVGFGTFTMAEKPERIGINHKTKEKITIAARKTVKFKPAAELGQ